MRQEVTIESSGFRLAGWFYTPAGGSKRPAILMSHGISAVKEQGLEGFATRFLRRSEVSVRILPDFKKLLIALRRRSLVELSLRACSAEQAENVIGSLRRSGTTFSKSQTAVANSRLEIPNGLLRIFDLQGGHAKDLRPLGSQRVRSRGR